MSEAEATTSTSNGCKRSSESNGEKSLSVEVKKCRTLEPQQESIPKPLIPDVVLDVSSEDENVSSTLVIDRFELNAGYAENIECFKNFYRSENVETKTDFIENNVEIIQKPFQVVKMLNFVKNEEILGSLIDFVSKLVLYEKNSDLISCKQSKDLKSYPNLKNVVDFFQNDVKKFMEELTGSKLNDNVALTFSRYDKNDYLLCHDDQLDGRKFAFIWYMVDEEWSADDGGQLELFSVNEDQGGDRQPVQVEKRLVPKRDSFVFFPVQPISFHQVGEVLTSRSPRLSINGWFHSDDAKTVNIPFVYPRMPTFSEDDILDDDLSGAFYQWINPLYLNPSVQMEIKRKFASKSEMVLDNFLNPRKQRQLEAAFGSPEVMCLWRKFYKPLFCHCECIDFEDFQSLPDVLKEFVLLVQSEDFYRLMLKLTGVVFNRKIPEKNGQVSKKNNEDDDSSSDDDVQFLESSSQIQPIISDTSPDQHIRGSIIRWNHGHYSLTSDINPELNEKALDIDFFFNVLSENSKEHDPEVIDLSDSDENKEESMDSETEPKIKNKDPKPIPGEEQKSDTKTEPEVIELDDESSVSQNEKDFDDYSQSNSGRGDDSQSSDIPPNDHGGYLAYIADDFAEQVLELEPKKGALNMVYRRYKCQRFMKYIDTSNDRVPFYQFSMVFSESRGSNH